MAIPTTSTGGPARSLQRWNFASFITSQATGNTPVDVAPLMVGEHAGRASRTRSASAPSPVTCRRALKQSVTGYLAAAPITAARVREAFALALSSNAFQWY